MKVCVKSKIQISNPSDAILDYCKKNLVLDNPDYFKKERMGKWLGNTPRTIQLYEKIGDDLVLPFGCLQDVWKMHPVKSDFIIEIFPITSVKYDSHISLYPYQEKTVEEAIHAKNGIVVMPCGSGKTQCGLEIISRVGGRALWLTHTQDLLNQSKKRAESVLGTGGNMYGTITAGKVNIGSNITFATVQTLSKLNLSEYIDTWDIIIVDECQHCCGSPTRVTQFYKVLSGLSARYKIGLTATPKRADGLQQSMYALLGPKIYEVSREDVAHTTCPVKVSVIPTGWTPDFDCVLMADGTIDYSKVISNMTTNAERYELIVNKLLELDGPTMVLGNRVEYLNHMCISMKDYGSKCVCLSGQGQSKRVKEERKKALEQLNNGEIDMVFATYQLAKEGLDVPNLRYVVFATPEQDETTVVQSVGRVGRKAEGKDYGTVIDFVDNFGMYHGWLKKRLRYYKRINAEVEQ